MDSFSSTPAWIKPTESQKKQKLSAILELLKQKAKCPPVKFVVDVGTIENILDFFKGRSVHVIFYVKNQTQLQIPPSHWLKVVMMMTWQL